VGDLSQNATKIAFCDKREAFSGALVHYAVPRKQHIVNYKNKYTLSLPGRRGFLTLPICSVQVILKSTIIPFSGLHP